MFHTVILITNKRCVLHHTEHSSHCRRIINRGPSSRTHKVAAGIDAEEDEEQEGEAPEVGTSVGEEG